MSVSTGKVNAMAEEMSLKSNDFRERMLLDHQNAKVRAEVDDYKSVETQEKLYVKLNGGSSNERRAWVGRGVNRVPSPSLTLDSGRGSSSTPSSPIKEMSPVSSANNTETTTRNNTETPTSLFYLPFSQNKKSASSEVSSALPKREDLLAKSQTEESQDLSLIRIDCCKLCGLNLKYSCSCPPEPIRKDSLEDDEPPQVNMEDFLIPKSYKSASPTKNKPTSPSSLFTMDDLNVPNEVFAHQNNSTKTLNNNSIPMVEDLSLEQTCSSTGDEAKSLEITDMSESERDSSLDLSLTTESNPEKKIHPMAFTIEFDDGPNTFGISDSISKFAPKHFRSSGSAKADKSLTDDEGSSLKKRHQPFMPVRLRQIDVNKTLANSKLPKANLSSSKSSRANNVKSLDLSSSVGSKEQIRGLDESAELKERMKSTNNTHRSSMQNQRPKSMQPEDFFKSSESPSQSFMARRDAEEKAVKGVNLLDPAEKVTSLEDSMVNKKVNLEQQEEASSETGTYTIENDDPTASELEKARSSIDKVFGMDLENITKRSKEKTPSPVKEGLQRQGSLESEWIREWAEQAALQQERDNEDERERSSFPDTRLFLNDTQTVVNAMQDRMRHSYHNSFTTEDERVPNKTSPKKRNFSPKLPVPIVPAAANNTAVNKRNAIYRETSVMSDSGYRLPSEYLPSAALDYRNIAPVKTNKVLNVRKGHSLGYESEGTNMAAMNRQRFSSPVQPSPTQGVPPALAPASNSNQSFVRHDGGRYSLRMPKSKETSPKHYNNSSATMPHPHASPQVTPAALRSVSSSANKTKLEASKPISSSSTYGKMKPGLGNERPQSMPAQGRKPPGGSRSNSTLTAKEVELANWKRRKSYDPMRAAAEARDKRSKGYSSDIPKMPLDDIPSMSPNHYSTMDLTTTPVHNHNNNHMNNLRGRSCSRCSSAEEDEEYMVVFAPAERSQSNSPVHHIPRSNSTMEDHYYYGLTNVALRPKNKLEALDNLVIATIHNLSSKVRNSSRQLLEKLQVQHAADENGALLEEMISQLRDLEMSSSSAASSPNKSPSRELSGALKNLKKLEEVILVLDRVLCDDSGSDQT